MGAKIGCGGAGQIRARVMLLIARWCMVALCRRKSGSTEIRLYRASTSSTSASDLFYWCASDEVPKRCSSLCTRDESALPLPFSRAGLYRAQSHFEYRKALKSCLLMKPALPLFARS